MAEIFIGIGSNLGRRKENINRSLELMAEKINIKKVSRLYKNSPKEGVKGGYFMNCVAKGETSCLPEELVLFLQKIEKTLGREKTHKHGEARTIDLDILFYDDKKIDEKNLKIPHPRLYYRSFVLKGLMEIAPCKKHPVLNKSIKQLWETLNENNIKNS